MSRERKMIRKLDNLENVGQKALCPFCFYSMVAFFV